MTSHQSVGQAQAANRRFAHYALTAACAAALVTQCGALNTLPSVASVHSLGASCAANSRPSLARLSMQGGKADMHGSHPEEQPATRVTSPGGLVEVGSFHAKRDFIVTEHLLSAFPDHIRSTAEAPTGTMALVGAGPGDPDLLTMAAHKELQKADLVVSDRLVSPEILGLVKCELRVAQKFPGCATQAQREIYRWCFEALMQGKRVVRLKIGDPFVFGRGGEEVAEFRRFGVEPTVVPGISSALAGPMSAMIPVTHRGVANKVAFCTGMDRNEDTPSVPVYDSEQTVVYLMAVGRLRELCERMVKRGYPKGTPVGIIERATTPQQREVIGTLDEIADVAEEHRVKAPAIVVVGEVVRALGSGGLESDASEQGFAVEWLADNGLLELPGLRK